MSLAARRFGIEWVRVNDKARADREAIERATADLPAGAWTLADLEALVGVERAGRISMRLPPHVKARQLQGEKDTPRRFSDDDVVAAIRAFYNATGSVSHDAYERWIRLQDGKWPSSILIINQRGGWNVNVARAGLVPNPPQRAHYDRMPDETLWAAVERFYRDTWRTTAADYDAWARGKDVPSLATIRNRLGRWTPIMRTVIEKVDNDG